MAELKELISQHRLIFMDSNDNPIEIKDYRIFEGDDNEDVVLLYPSKSRY